MDVKIEPSWKRVLEPEFGKPYFARLTAAVRDEYNRYQCFPPGHLVFNSFNLCPFDKVKVVIIGQDPYHEPGQAMGLSFSVPDGVPMPPSLQNIFKEIHDDLGTPVPASGNLTRWEEQGVLLMNLIDQSKHLVLESVHPSPLSANRGGWFGQHQFSRCNEYLRANGEEPVKW